MPDLLTMDDFKPHVGKTVRFAGGAHELVLESVQGEGVAPQGWPRAPFIVTFRGPKPGPVMAEGFYECEIADGPTLGLHVSPIHTPQPDRQDYQAAFN
jgi:hypothetical protein